MTNKLFQISEDDLIALERELPEILSQTYMQCNDPIYRKRWELVKNIVGNIRWNYGPPNYCEEIKL